MLRGGASPVFACKVRLRSAHRHRQRGSARSSEFHRLGPPQESLPIMVAATARTQSPPHSSPHRPRLAHGGAVVCAVWLAAACNQAFGLDPVVRGDAAAGDVGDAVDVGDAPACEPHAAGQVAGGAALEGVFMNGVAAVVRHGDRLFLFGVHNTRGTDGALAAISLPPPTQMPMWTTRSIGGASNDQLWAAASTGDEFLAGGMTRSFQTSTLDEGLLLRLDSTNTLTSRRLRAGVAIQVRAVAAAPPGEWWLAGAAGTNDGFVARLNPMTTTVAAIPFTIDGSRPVPRRIVDAPDDGSAPFVVGQLGGGTGTGFVARIDSDPVVEDSSWAVTVQMEVFDAAWFDASLWVAGDAGGSGLLLRFDGAGGLLESWRVPSRPLHRVDHRGATTWLGGATNAGLFVATIAGDCVTGTDLAMLTPAQPLRATLPLEVAGDVPYLAGRVGTSARAIPLGEDGSATCGVPFAVARQQATITPTVGVVAAGAPLALAHEPVSTIGAPIGIAAPAPTCP
ncbi:MAG: hypothetical protein R3B06_02965 [Kofleriaceae bacterium]